MKQTIIIIATACLVFSIGGCKKAPIVDENATIYPIELDDTGVIVDRTNIIGRIQIESGNGEYSIVYPKKIRVSPLVYNGGIYDEVDYSPNILYLHIDPRDNIVVELRLLTDQKINGIFMVRDAKGEKRLFYVRNFIALHDTDPSEYEDRKKLEQALMNDPDFWQE